MSGPAAPDPGPIEEYGDSGESGGFPAFLRDPKGILRRRWRWMLFALVLGLAGTGAFVWTLEPTYLAKATVLVTSQRISEEFVRPTVESDEFERINALVGEVFSRRSLADLVQKHGLYADPELDLSMEARVVRARGNAAIEGETETLGRQRGQQARIYAITFRADEPEVAAAVANGLAERFTAAHVRMRDRQVRVTTDFLRRELERAERELRAQEERITEFKQQYRGELPSELNANLARLERLQQERESLATQIADAETRLALLAAGSVSSGAGDIDSSSPEARLAALRSRLEQELAVRTEEHPNVISLRRQVAALEKEVTASPDADGMPSRPSLAAGARSSVDEMRRQRARIEREIEALDARVARTPEREEELAALMQREAVLREGYVSALRKVKQAELAEAVESAQQGERATVLDQALPPRTPEQTPLLFLAGGIVASLGLAVGVGLLWELFDAVLLQADQVEAEFGVPVVGSIAHIA